MPTPANVTVLTLGGTIAMRDEGQGATPSLSARALIGDVTVDGVHICAESFLQVPSCALTLADLTSLAARVRKLVSAGTDGVVISQGTDTLAESAFTLDLLLATDVPVVVTGAMRHPTLPGADGPANITNAIRVAASDDARGLGVLVAMNDEVHTADHVRKTNTVSTAAFASPATGPIGWVVEGRLRLLVRPAPGPTVDPGTRRVDVALLSAALGDDLRLLDHLDAAGYRGVVVELFGGGHTPPDTVPRLAAVAAQIPVVFASRVGAGPTFRATYGYPGSERDLLANGLIGAGWLDGAKARTLLSLVLAEGSDVRQAFSRFGGG